MNPNDIFAYLIVLNHPPTMMVFRVQGIVPYIKHIPGSACRLRDQLERLSWASREYRAILHLLEYRERLNGYLPLDNPLFTSATQQLAELLAKEVETLYQKENQAMEPKAIGYHYTFMSASMAVDGNSGRILFK